MFLRALVSRHRERKSSSNKMAAGLNHMVARQSKMAIKNHYTDHRVNTHTDKPGSLHQSESEVAQSYLTVCDPWTVANQAFPSMGFSRQEYWSGLPFPSPGDLLDPGIEPRSPWVAGRQGCIAGRSLNSEPPRKPNRFY